jgi:hypothetical protein
MRCGLLMTNRGVLLKFRSTSSAAKGAALEFGIVLVARGTRPACNAGVLIKMSAEVNTSNFP